VLLLGVVMRQEPGSVLCRRDLGAEACTPRVAVTRGRVRQVRDPCGPCVCTTGTAISGNGKRQDDRGYNYGRGRESEGDPRAGDGQTPRRRARDRAGEREKTKARKAQGQRGHAACSTATMWRRITRLPDWRPVAPCWTSPKLVCPAHGLEGRHHARCWPRCVPPVLVRLHRQ